MLVDPRTCKALKESLLPDKVAIEHAIFNRKVEERALSLSAYVIRIYKGTIVRVEGDLVNGKERFANVVSRITILKNIFRSMGQWNGVATCSFFNPLSLI